MPNSRTFLRACALLAASAALMVLVAQFLLTDYSPGVGRGGAIALYTHPIYRAQSWVILVQVFCMFLALWGAAACASRYSPALIGTGFLVFCFWQVCEFLPLSMELWTVSYEWAPEYLAEPDAATRAVLDTQIATISGITAAIGGIRRQLWALGHLLFAIAFLRRPNIERILGAFSAFNAARLLLRVAGEVTGVDILANAFSGRMPFVLGMTPLFGLLALWLWQQASIKVDVSVTAVT